MIARSFALAAAALMPAGSVAFALDHSTKDAGPRSPVELCCVDAAQLPPIETSVASERGDLLGSTRLRRRAKPSRALTAPIGIAGGRTARAAASPRCTISSI
jgi:hypothetical protein